MLASKYYPKRKSSTTMASFFSPFTILTSLCLLFPIISTADLIDDICRKSDNPTLCLNSLKSDPRSSGSDKWGLGLIALDKAVAATKTAITKAKSIQNRSNKQAVNECVQNFHAAIDDLNNFCRPILASKSGQLRSLDARLTTAFDHVVAFRGDYEVEKLKSSIQNVADLITVIGAVSLSLKK